jgi:hypothetical protein
MIWDFINWCGDNYWWFVLGNFILVFGLPLLGYLLTGKDGGLGQYPGCGVIFLALLCLLGPILYALAAFGLIIMLVDYLFSLFKKED